MQKFFIFFLLVLTQRLFAQETLPKLSVTSISDNNILIAWTNPYTTLTAINIQRSDDSTKNFTTIGSVLDVTNTKNGFIDATPLSSKMYYRVFLSFEGGTYMFTKSYRAIKDTSKTPPDTKEFQQSIIYTWFTPSKLVYTGRGDNIIISLPGAPKKKYVIKFFEENGTPVFELNKISEPYLILEKANFLHAGIFDFEIYEDGILIEKHKVYVPKDGMPIPNLK